MPRPAGAGCGIGAFEATPLYAVDVPALGGWSMAAFALVLGASAAAALWRRGS